jgi:hypothetical protein
MQRRALVGVFAVVVVPLAIEVVREHRGERSASAQTGHTLTRALRGWELVESDEFIVQPNSSSELIANCPSGAVPLGGGFAKAPSTPDSPAGVEIAASFPAFFRFEEHLTSGWIVHVINRSSANALVTVWATCARRGAAARPLD